MNILNIEHIHKIFGDKVIFDDISCGIDQGEKIGIIGVNGTGKTTLLRVIAGEEEPDEGQVITQNGIRISWLPQTPEFPQHMTILDYVAEGKWQKDSSTESEARRMLNTLGITDENSNMDNLSGGEKKRVALARMLLNPADILILDEPTAVLTPQETEKLFTVLRNMREAGHSIIIITHKLHEVLSLSDRVSVLRKGAYIGTVQTKDATEASLTEMMVGKKVALNIERPEPVNPQKRLVMEHVTCVDKEGVKTLDDAGFTAYSGEILGIAGIAGSGQKELLETIAGLQPMEGGTIRYYPPEGGEETLSGMSPAAIRKLGIKLSFVPEDRLGMGLVAAMGMTDNMMLRGYKKGIPFFTDRRTPKAMAEQLIKELEIVTPGVSTPVGRLSGGNVQKVLVGREISSNPRVLMVAYPVRGLDINSSYTIYHFNNFHISKFCHDCSCCGW